MSTPCNVQAVRSPTTPFFDASALRAMLDRLRRAWTARRQARAEKGVDAYFARERKEHERFLSQATDAYQLEHLERAWERRHIDMWREY